jgi:hypothetical protein
VHRLKGFAVVIARPRRGRGMTCVHARPTVYASVTIPLG